MTLGNSATLVEQVEHWGYYLLPPPHAHCPGYSGLLVALRDRPTRLHYDPESIQLEWLNPRGLVEPMTLTRQTNLDKARRVAPGSVTLSDRRSKEELFYSFGGTLETVAAPGETVFSLRSNAPVLWLSKAGDGVADQLAAEVGRLLGALRANAGGRDDDFFRRLARLDPLALYTAALSCIFSDYERNPPLRESYPELHLTLHEEKKWLEETGQWPDNPHCIDELVGVQLSGPV